MPDGKFMKNSSQYGRKANQKCAYAEAILALPQEYFLEFVGQALLEAAYLEMEQALCLHVAEELARFGHVEAFRAGEMLDRAWLERQLQQTITAAVLLEIRQLRGARSSWLTALLAVCDQARTVPEGEKALKSPLFADDDGDAASSGLIKAVTQRDSDGKLELADAQSDLKALLEFFSRHRSDDEEY